jgi:hypothetical protein
VKPSDWAYTILWSTNPASAFSAAGTNVMGGSSAGVTYTDPDWANHATVYYRLEVEQNPNW